MSATKHITVGDVVVSVTTAAPINFAVHEQTFAHFDCQADGQRVQVGVITGKRPHVTVLVCNAALVAWRGMGRDFSTLDVARDHYKLPKVKAAISAVIAMLAQKADQVAA